MKRFTQFSRIWVFLLAFRPKFCDKKMRLACALLIAALLFSCKKDDQVPTPPPPGNSKILLKELSFPSLPSPYYRFEYDTAGKPVKVSYSSDFNMYEVSYHQQQITEIKNNTRVNKDRLLYTYDDNGKITLIRYMDQTGVVYKKCYLEYGQDRLQKMEWERKANPGYVLERVLSFVYHPDGNLKEMTNYYTPFEGQTERTWKEQFDQYDDKINTDGFMLVHHHEDHLLLLPGVQLQKNNPRKLVRTGYGINYTIDYSYTYNTRNAPTRKIGDVLFTNGPNEGKNLISDATLTYYP